MLATGGGSTGYRLPNGSYIGTISDLFYERADLALITGQVFERYPIIGFSRPFYFASLIFTVGIPKPVFTYSTIFKPLLPHLWAIFVGTNAVFVLIFLISNKYSPSNSSNSGDHNWKFLWTLEFVIASIFEQGLSLTRKKSGRLFCILLLFFLMVFSTAYKAKLFTFLIYPEKSKPPETFTELTQSDGFKYGLESAGIGAAIHAALKASTNPTFVKINNEMSLETDGVQCFLKGLYTNFACLAYVGQAEYIFYRNFSTPSKKYPFQISKETTFSPHATGFAYEKRSVFRLNFDRIFGPLLDGGLVWKMEKLDFENIRADRVRWQKQNGIKPIFTDEYFYSGPKKLRLEQLNGILICYLLLLLICLLGFFCEITFGKIQVKLNEKAESRQFIIPRINITDTNAEESDLTQDKLNNPSLHLSTFTYS